MKCLPRTLRHSVLVVAIVALVHSPAAGKPICSARDLKHLCPAELDELFSKGCVPTCPVGRAKGTVLVVCDAHCPKLRAKMAGTMWKGKDFCEDGSFTNRWPGFSAGGSHTDIQPSWYDGKPCMALEYAPSAAVFANTRDELREIAPGLYLGRFYERCPCQRHRGYFVLEMKGCK